MNDTEPIGVVTKGRLFAAGFDNLFATVLGLVSGRMVSEGSSSLEAVAPVVAIVAYSAYFVLFEALVSRTPGKMMFKLEINRLDGGAIGWPEASVRTFLRVIEANPLLLGILPGGIFVVLSKRRQRLGDLLAGTLVVERSAATTQGGG